MTQNLVRPSAGDPPRAPVGGERPLTEIVSELWLNTEKLLRQELSLASREIDDKLATAKREAALFAAGGAVLAAGLLALVAALILLLAEAIEPWLAAAIVGVVLAGVGYALLRRGPPQPAELAPTRTIESVKQDVRTFTEASK